MGNGINHSISVRTYSERKKNMILEIAPKLFTKLFACGILACCELAANIVGLRRSDLCFKNFF
jgi:hypothetical protein